MQLNQKNKKSLLLGAGALIVVAAIGAGLWMGAHPTPEPFYGMIQAKTVDISAKVTGRVKALPVVEGQDVKIGETLIELSIPEVEAKLKEVEALRTAADAMSKKSGLPKHKCFELRLGKHSLDKPIIESQLSIKMA